MTPEQIQKAAGEYAIGKTHYRRNILGQVNMDNYSLRKNDCIDDFIDGAKWRISAVWHSAQEMPSRNMRDGGVGELCLVETSDGDIEFVQACYESINGVYYFKAYFGALELCKITRWAYVSDLIPTEELV